MTRELLQNVRIAVCRATRQGLAGLDGTQYSTLSLIENTASDCSMEPYSRNSRYWPKACTLSSRTSNIGLISIRP